jgi:putative addiction module component (TIGR02574 family)
MNAVLKHLVERARLLTPEERLQLVDDILQSVHGEGDETIEAALRSETRDRLSAYEAGEMSARPAKDVLARFLKV